MNAPRRPFVVQFGAGAIGRGFLGQLWTEGGFAVHFIDVNESLIAALNARQSYPLRLVTHDETQNLVVAPVSASGPAAAPQDVKGCAFVSTAVGVGVFEQLAPLLAEGIAARAETGEPLNILCCENQAGTASLLREAVSRQYTGSRDYFEQQIGFVDASVGRMVPPPTLALLAEDPLLVLAEPYHELPIDASAWRGPVPSIPGLLPKANFPAYVARKLYTHNGGHAALAYHGFLRGHTSIYQALQDLIVRAELLGFWEETGAALIAAYGFPPDEQREHEADLRRRFANRALGDTVARVGRDVRRKLRRDDRLVGAGLLCLRTNPDRLPSFVVRAIAAALRFAPHDDQAAQEVQKLRIVQGTLQLLVTLTGLPPTHPLIRAAVAVYNEQASTA